MTKNTDSGRWPILSSRLARAAITLLVLAGMAAAVPRSATAEQGEVVVRPVAASSIATGIEHTCAVLTTGAVRCWGDGRYGKLGYSSTSSVGDSPAASIISAGDVPLGGKAAAITLGAQHTCALMVGGAVRCWGVGKGGRLGYGSQTDVGNSPTSSIIAAGDVPLGGKAVAVSAGESHTCALLVGGSVRCWGSGANGRLGYGNTRNVGDSPESSISAVGDVPIGGKATAISAGGAHTCALLTGGSVRCWGLGGDGQLGHGSRTAIGHSPVAQIAHAGDVPLGGRARAIATGSYHSCAVLTGGDLRCWGNGGYGQLGYNSYRNVGDTPSTTIINAGDVPVGGQVVGVAAGQFHTCALLESGSLRCWGSNVAGELGYNHTVSVGDSTASSIQNAGDVPLGATAAAIATGGYHTCAILVTAKLRCWGYGYEGQLGYGSMYNVGDSPPTSIINTGDVPVGLLVRTRVQPRLNTHVALNRRRSLYDLDVDGKLQGAFAPDPMTCGGIVSVEVVHGKRKLASQKASVGSQCVFRTSLKLRGISRGARLTVRLAYAGTADLAPTRGSVRVVAGR